MTPEQISSTLADVGAVMTNNHFVYTSGRHGGEYFNKDAVYLHPRIVSDLCKEMSDRIHQASYYPNAIIAPAVGGLLLSQGIALHLSQRWWGPEKDIPALYAERSERSLIKADHKIPFIGITLPHHHPNLQDYLEKGEELVIKETNFVLKRGQDKVIINLENKDVAVAEDVLHTGKTAIRTIEAVRRVGGNPRIVVALCNRGGVTAEQLGVEKLITLLDVKMETWNEGQCPLCIKGVPINTDVGHGKAFAERQQTADRLR